MMDETPEFAEEYTFRERVWLIVRGLVIGCVVILAWKLWLLPEFSAFVASAPCRTVFGVNGTTYLWYGLFVGLPLFMFLVYVLMEGRYGLRILRDGQFPAVGAKVLRTTRIKRGAAARRIGYLYLLAPTLFLAVAAWGFLQARSLAQQSQLRHAACTADYSLKRSAAESLGQAMSRSQCSSTNALGLLWCFKTPQ